MLNLVIEELPNPLYYVFDDVINYWIFLQNKMVRFHEPPPFWGPKSKPKRKAEKDANDPNDQVIFANNLILNQN